MTVAVLPADTRWQHLDTLLLDGGGLLKVHPAAVFDALDPVELRAWQHHRAVYQLPTQELVDWMRDEVGIRSALEVGAGRGWLGRALNIPMTDSWLQKVNPTVAAIYALTGQPVIPYSRDVERLDAAAAVAKYRPQVVFGCWVTQIAYAHEPPGDGNAWGLDEDALLDQVETYIVVGSRKVHGTKRLLKRRHEVITLPGLRSRAQNVQDNVIYVWRR